MSEVVVAPIRILDDGASMGHALGNQIQSGGVKQSTEINPEHAEEKIAAMEGEARQSQLEQPEQSAVAAKAKSDVPLEASIPEGACPLESILRTEELYRRPSRPPDYEKENRALVALSSALADSPRTILQTLAEKVLEIVQADSSGLSLLTKDEKRFYWPAIAARGSHRDHSSTLPLYLAGKRQGVAKPDRTSGDSDVGKSLAAAVQ